MRRLTFLRACGSLAFSDRADEVPERRGYPLSRVSGFARFCAEVQVRFERVGCFGWDFLIVEVLLIFYAVKVGKFEFVDVTELVMIILMFTFRVCTIFMLVRKQN